jgi:hypothetical protein
VFSIELPEQHEGGGERGEGEKSRREFFVASADASRSFEFLEEVLDEVPLFIEVSIKWASHKTILARGDHDAAAIRFERENNVVGVVRKSPRASWAP